MARSRRRSLSSFPLNTEVFRRALFWCHLVCGVVAGIVVLIMCVTGVALTYQKELQYWADTRHFHAGPAPGATRTPASELVGAARTIEGAMPTTVTWRSSPDEPAAVAIAPAPARTIYLNPYTAEVHGEGTGAGLRAFFASMTSWHRYLAMSEASRPTARAITGAANLLFLFIVLSGMYLWWPRTLTWTQVRHVIWFRGGLRAKARDFNWHNTLGFWSAVPLALVVYSGTVLSYSWSSDLVYRAFGETPPTSGRGGANAASPARPSGWPSTADRIVERVLTTTQGWQSIAWRLPASPDAPLIFTIDRGDAGQPNLRATLTIDPATGETMKREDFSTQTAGRRARTTLRFLHTGEIAGLSGQTFAGLASAAGAVLVYTGLAMSLRRFNHWRRRPSRPV
jgi:uncharacterized iron-regulated membrane protein